MKMGFCLKVLEETCCDSAQDQLRARPQSCPLKPAPPQHPCLTCCVGSLSAEGRETEVFFINIHFSGARALMLSTCIMLHGLQAPTE